MKNRFAAMVALGLTVLSGQGRAADYYVDANAGDDGWDGSTPNIPTQEMIDAGGQVAGPRRTLQAGVALAQNAGDIVHAAPGRYAEGGAVDADGVSNRVYITKASVGLVADMGNAVTFLEGRFSTVDPANVCGPDAMRAIRISGKGTYVKGFTICNGSTPIDANYCGGGLHGGAAIDCVFTNCATVYRGIGAAYATLVNCTIRSGVKGSYNAYDCSAYNCVFRASSYGNGTMLNCSFIGTGPTGRSGHQPMYNCYIESPNKNSDYYRCFYVGATNATASFCDADCRKITVAEANLDPSTCRPRAGSVLMDAGSDEYYDEKYDAAYKESFAQYDHAFTPRHRGAAVDIGALEGDWAESFADILSAGNDLFSVTDVSDAAYTDDARTVSLPSGTSLAARWANPSGSARVAEVSFTAAASEGATLKVYLNGSADPAWTLAAEDGTKTITYLSRTDDVLVFVSEGTAGKATLADFTSTAHKCFYVSPEGDDGNDGLTLATAKRTLCGAMAIEGLASAGRVYAAPGVYREGEVDGYGASNHVAVVDGIGLESIEGPDVTVIEGFADPGTEEEGVVNGCGMASVRCAYVADKAWLRGFTIRNGHTRAGGNSTYNGGGVSVDDGAVVECVITNNVAGYRGGGGSSGSYIRCTIGENSANNGNGNAVVNGSLYGCHCHTSSFYSQTKIVNCTFVNVAPRGNTGVWIYNTISTQSDSKNGHLYRCLYGGSLASTSEMGDLTEMDLGKSTVAGMLDGDGVPKFGSKPVDFGDVNHYVTNFPTAYRQFMWLDCRGAQRVSNGKIDCGAFEYDWRGEFASRMKQMSKYALEVTSASPDVTTNALGQVTLTDGTSLAVAWTVATDDTLGFCVPVTGGGAVTVSVDGRPVTPEAATGRCQIDVAAGDHRIEIAFAGEGSATAHSFALSQKGLMLLVR